MTGQYTQLEVDAKLAGLSTSEKFITTDEGGIGVKMINKTGAASVKGTIVEASLTTDNAFGLTGATDYMPIGAVYENGIADGEECTVIIYGIAELLLQDSTASTKGYWVNTSDTQAGRVDATVAIPAGGTITALENHMREVGHCIESKTAGTNVLAKCVMHFN